MLAEPIRLAPPASAALIHTGLVGIAMLALHVCRCDVVLRLRQLPGGGGCRGGQGGLRRLVSKTFFKKIATDAPRRVTPRRVALLLTAGVKRTRRSGRSLSS